MNCRNCGEGPMIPLHAAGVGPRHMGRGLCRPCYLRGRRYGFKEFSRKRPWRRNSDVIEDWQFLTKEYKYSRKPCADRMGIRRDALDKAISRWKERQACQQEAAITPASDDMK